MSIAVVARLRLTILNAGLTRRWYFAVRPALESKAKLRDTGQPSNFFFGMGVARQALTCLAKFKELHVPYTFL